MSVKSTHFGMAGHYVAMAEFLRRGWNVATMSTRSIVTSETARGDDLGPTIVFDRTSATF